MLSYAVGWSVRKGDERFRLRNKILGSGEDPEVWNERLGVRGEVGGLVVHTDGRDLDFCVLSDEAVRHGSCW